MRKRSVRPVCYRNYERSMKQRLRPNLGYTGWHENTAKYGWDERPVYIIHKGRYYSGGKMKTLLPAYWLTQNRAKFLPQ
jgi:hypothetical protein